MGGEGYSLNGRLVVVLEERARVQQLDARDFLGGRDVRRVFFVVFIYWYSGGYSLYLAVELDELLELSSRCDKVLFLPEVVEQVQGVEGVEVCEDAGSVVGDLADEAGDGSVVVGVAVADV